MSSQESNLRKARSHLERLAGISQQLVRSVKIAEQESDPELKSLAFDGIGARVQAAYTGLETLLEASLASLGITIPKGQSSHKELLNAAEQHSLVTKEERQRLDEIKGFRHIQRHVYDITLDPKILMERTITLAKLLPTITARIDQILQKRDKPPGFEDI